MSKLFYFFLSLVYPCVGLAKGNFKIYKVDWQPLENEIGLYEKFKIISAKPPEKQTSNEMKLAIEIIEKVLVKDPNWLDGYWLIGSLTFQLGSTYTDERDHHIARKIFKKGRLATETCLKKDPDHILCKLFLGSSIGKIGAIDGIFSSLRNAKLVKDLWLEVANSGVDYQFMENVSLQGSVNYALGMFHRLVPDLLILDWLFDVRGNINDSIQFHRKSLEYDGVNPCNALMLAVALLCKVDGDVKKTDEGKEAIQWLKKVKSTKTEHETLKVCVSDSQKIIEDTSLACGYDTSKQQEGNGDFETK